MVWGDSLHFFTDTFPPKTYNQSHQNVNFHSRTSSNNPWFLYIFLHFPHANNFQNWPGNASTPYVYNIFTNFAIKSIFLKQIFYSFTFIYQCKLYKIPWQNQHFYHLIPSFKHSFLFIFRNPTLILTFIPFHILSSYHKIITKIPSQKKYTLPKILHKNFSNQKYIQGHISSRIIKVTKPKNQNGGKIKNDVQSNN